MELLLNRLNIIKNISMIELKVIHDQGAWAVMNEFRALIKEGTIIFIRFNHKNGLLPKRAETSKLPGTPPITKPGS